MTFTTLRAAAFGIGPLEEEVADRLRNGARHHRIGNRGDTGSAGDRDEGVQAPARPRRDADGNVDFLQPFRQPAQTKQYENRCDDLDEQLRNGKVGRRKPDEGHAGDKSRTTHQDQRGKPVVLCLQAAPTAQTIPTAQIIAKRGSKPAPVGGRSSKPVRRIGQSAARNAAATSKRSCCCRRRVPRCVSTQRAQLQHTVPRMRSKMRDPSASAAREGLPRSAPDSAEGACRGSEPATIAMTLINSG